MRYETTNITQKHTIESACTLECTDTGRVVAVFYNQHDLLDVIEADKKIDELKAKLKEAYERLDECDGMFAWDEEDYS